MQKFSRILLALLFILKFSIGFAQKSSIYTHDLKDFNTAVDLFKENQLVSAQLLFNKLTDENNNAEMLSDCYFYSANCALLLQQNNAGDLMQQFINNYPTSPKQNQACSEIAYYYFKQGQYNSALEWFEKVDEHTIVGANLDRYYFQKGYSFFSSNNKKEATTYFNRLLQSAEFGLQAKYYLGFMAYDTDDYKKANTYFGAVSGDEKYKEKLSYFQSEMNFKLGNFQKAIDLGQIAMAKSAVSEKSELNKIIGESYFNLAQYDKSIPYFILYKGKKGKWNTVDFYQLGFAYYQQNDFENAVSQFNKIIAGNDFIAQNAYYHLGECYLKTNKKQQALNAFKNASEMQFDLIMQEDASLNYAKLSYDIGNSYQNVSDVLASFLIKYPNSANKVAVEALLIDSFITSKNYKGALELLEKNKNFANKIPFQKVAFYRGLELFTDGNYLDALELFQKSLSVPVQPKFVARATFWKAETEFVLDNFKESLLSFKQFIALAEAQNTFEIKNLNYNIAYCYFKLKEYEPAGNYFQSYIEKNKTDKIRLNDAYLRLGDSRFVTSKYWQAIDACNKAIELKSVAADYAAFQKAISYGFVAKNDKKIESLLACIAQYLDSQYRDDALFELGNTYVIEKKTDLALKTFDQLITEYKDGSYTSKALLRQGLLYFNAENDALALGKFKKVVADFPKSPESIEAVATARLIYLDNGKVAEYAAWVKTLDFIAVSDADVDNDTYEAAEKQFLLNNTKQAISAFSDYTSQFPSGIHALKANFYLAQSYFSEDLAANAISNYEFVISKPRSEFTEQSLARLCQIYVKKSDDLLAIATLKRLETEADFPQNRTFAQSNLMKIFFVQKQYLNAVAYAVKVLGNLKIDNKLKSDAEIIVARSAFLTNDFNKARASYMKLLDIATGELAAEALYYDAYFKNKDTHFEDSNIVIQKLTKEYSGYKYFGAMGLLLLAKNCYGLKDSFQATYILESVIKNFVTFPDIVQEAQVELDQIKEFESKTNASIQK